MIYELSHISLNISNTCLIHPHAGIGCARGCTLLAGVAAGASTHTRVAEERDDPAQDDHDEPSEEDRDSGNPESCPPVHGSIGIGEGRLEPQNDHGQGNPGDEDGDDEVDDPV